MSGGLIGHNIRTQATRFCPRRQLRHQLSGIAQQADRDGFFLRTGFFNHRQRLIEAAGLIVHITGTQTEINVGFLAFNGQDAGPCQHASQRLGAAHTTKPCRQNPFAPQVAVVVLSARFGKSFIRPLHNALRTNVNPGACSHLAVHHQARFIQFVKVVPVGPVRHNIGVSNQHARRIGMGAKNTDRLTGLYQQGFVFTQRPQAVQNGFEGRPVAGGFTNTAIDHQVFRAFGNIGVKVVLDHAISRFDQPVLTTQRCSLGSANDMGGGIFLWRVHGHILL